MAFGDYKQREGGRRGQMRQKQYIFGDIRQCLHCKLLKRTEEFYLRRRQDEHGRRNSTCQDCKKKYNLKYYYETQTSPEYKAHKAKLANIRKLKYRFGLTEEQHKEMQNKQNNQCAICGGPEVRKGRGLSIDHCHKTGKIRELLCSHCNLGIGNFKDNPELLQAAIAYLGRHNQSPIDEASPGERRAIRQSKSA